MRLLKITFVFLLAFCFVSGTLISQPPKTPSWGWKLATTPEDAHNFINGLGAYKRPHAVQTIAASSKGFYIFYRGDLRAGKDWGWKLASTTTDAMNFLNRKGAYKGNPIGKVILAYKADKWLYFFYRGKSPKAAWGWKRSTAVDDMFKYLNGTTPYSSPKRGTIGGISTGEILMFYRGDKVGKAGWGWKLATTIDDAHNFLNGKGAYKTPVKRTRIFATEAGHFYIFYKK